MHKVTEIAKLVKHAESRIRPFIRETFPEQSHYLSQKGKASVFCKLENLQHTGSFKVRGAFNKVLSLTKYELDRGIVAASTGNHGAAVAYCLNKLKAKGIIFVPNHIPPDKIKAIKNLGAEIQYYGDDNADTEVFARQFARDNRKTFISPYNDLLVICGQGTIGCELERQLAKIEAVFISLGGGGLLSGVAAYLKSINPKIEIIGCSPENSQVMIQSVKSGKILDLPSSPTLSDGTAGGLEPGTITYEMCRDWVDLFVTVTEDEIKNSLVEFIQNHHMLIEGAAAVSVASYLKMKDNFTGKNVVIIICGANISLETLAEVISH